jgi:hypothetical protein
MSTKLIDRPPTLFIYFNFYFAKLNSIEIAIHTGDNTHIRLDRLRIGFSIRSLDGLDLSFRNLCSSQRYSLL